MQDKYSGQPNATPRPQDRVRDTFEWANRKPSRWLALWEWGLKNLCIAPGVVAGRREMCFYRRREPLDIPLRGFPRDDFQRKFLAALELIQVVYGPDWPLATQLPASRDEALAQVEWLWDLFPDMPTTETADAEQTPASKRRQ